MGTPANTVDAHASFENEEQASAAFPLFMEWAHKANDGKGPEEGDFDISDIQRNGKFIYFFACSVHNFFACSGRDFNLQWQCEQIRDWFIKQPGILKVEIQVVIQGDAVYWEKEEPQLTPEDAAELKEIVRKEKLASSSEKTCSYCGSGLFNEKGNCQKCGL